MTISEKVAYLKGLGEGLELDTQTKEGKMISLMMDILEDVGRSIADLEENQMVLGDEIDEMGGDLSDLEDAVYADEDDEEEEEYYEIECPNCQEQITINEGILEYGSIQCPNCGEKLEFDLGECECDCGCEDEDKD